MQHRQIAQYIDTLTTIVQQQQLLLQKLLAQQPTVQTIQPGQRTPKRFIYYCHSHGYSSNPKHTSDTCKNLGPNHNTLPRLKIIRVAVNA